MSQVKVQGNASGTGVLTLTSPNTNSNYTLTLPANTGTLVTNATAGTVLQVVQATQPTEVSNSSATWATTGLTASITPSSSSSKILVRFTPNLYLGSSNSIGMGVRIDRSGTTIYTTGFVNNVSAIVILFGNYGIEYLDSPATTSSVTYTLQFNCPFANTPYVYPTISTNDYNGSSLYTNSTVILMEIAA